MSLQEPHLKMSKSHADARSRILLTDNPDDISRKVMAALTDSTNNVSFDPVARPGVSNLLQLLAHLDTDSRSAEKVTHQYAHMGLGEFKREVSQIITTKLSPVRNRYHEVMAADEGRYIDFVAAQGARKARESAEETMVLVREAVGF